MTIAPDKLRRRGERLIRLAYDLEVMTSECALHGMENLALSLRSAMNTVRRVGDTYIERAEVVGMYDRPKK